MRGHIRQRSKGSWSVVVSMGVDPATGKRRQVWRTVRGTKRDAEALLAQLIHEREVGIDMPSGKLTLADYLRRWLDDFVTTNVAAKTAQTYRDIVERHLIPALGNVGLVKLRPQHVQSYYARALRSGRLDGRGGLSAQSVRHHHKVLHGALRQAVRWQLLSRNPVDAVTAPKVERYTPKMLGPEDVSRLLAAAEETPNAALVFTAVLTGLRKGELLGLRWSDVDLDGATLQVSQTVQWLPRVGFIFKAPKTAKSRRTVALSPDTVQTLRRHRQGQLAERLKLGSAYEDLGLVFATPIGGPIDPSNLRRAWLLIIDAAGLKGLRFHDCRHIHASLLLHQGVHAKVISERLGHSGISITMDTYGHLAAGAQAEAVAGLDQVLRLAGGKR